MGSEQLRIEVTKARSRISWATLIGDLFAGVGPSGGLEKAGAFPEVAVCNSKGKRRVLDVLDTDQQAQDRAAIIEDDLAALRITEWCERYDVPISFIEQ